MIVTASILSWGFYINGTVVKTVANSKKDLIITDTLDQDGNFFNKEQVSLMKGIKSGNNKKVVAYISVGEAEDYRYYWKKEWKRKKPEWLGKENPEWKGNYSILQWWHPDWWDITKSQIDKIVDAGFDGIFLDKVDVYQDIATKKNYEELKHKMIEYVIKIKEYLKSKNPNAMLITQNAEELADIETFVNLIDAYNKENVVYTNDGELNDNDTIKYNLEQLDKFVQKGKLVLVTEYVKGKKLDKVKKTIENHKYLLYAGPVELDKLV